MGRPPNSVKQRPGWDGMAAVQTGQIYPFDDNLVSRPGPRLVDGLEALAKLLHPELFKSREKRTENREKWHAQMTTLYSLFSNPSP